MTPKESDSSSEYFGDMTKLIALCVAVGVAAGFGAIAFYWMLDGAKHFFMDYLAGWRPSGPNGEAELFEHTTTEFRRWVLALLPAAGGLVSGYLVYKFAPETAGHGTDAAIESYHFRDGAVRARAPFIKAITSAITIGTGGSGGREGPIAQIGAGFGSTLALKLGLNASQRRILMSAGMAAGIGAIFNAPLAGALFAAEVLYRDMDFEHEVLVPSFISSITAYSIFGSKFGYSPVFETPQNLVFDNPAHLLAYIGLAGFVTLGAIAFIKIFYTAHNGFGNWKFPNHLKPAIGGLLVGAMVLVLPVEGLDVIGTGYGIIQDAFLDPESIGWKMLLLVAVGKMFATSFSIGSGGSGGVFGPAIVIGGALGGAFGLLCAQCFPNLGGQPVQPAAFVIVGMAGFFAAAANCPISTIIMVSELTDNYHLLVPAMLVCVLSYLLCRKYHLYEKQIGSRLDAPTKMGNMLGAVLGKISVKEALERSLKFRQTEPLISLGEASPLSQIVETFASSDQPCFPVLSSDGKLMGVIDGRDVRRTLGEDKFVADLVVAGDLVRPAVTILPGDSLLDAVHKMNASEIEELIVVEPEDEHALRATISHNQIVHAYDAALYKGKR